MPWGSKELELVRQQIAGLQEFIVATREEIRSTEDATAAMARLADAQANLKRLKARRVELLANRGNYRRRAPRA